MGLRIHHLPYSLPLYIMVYIRINNNIINNNTTNINKSAIYEHIHIDNNTSALSLSIYTHVYIYIRVCIYILYIYVHTPFLPWLEHHCQVRGAYRKLALKVHPDKQKDKDSVELLLGPKVTTAIWRPENCPNWWPFHRKHMEKIGFNVFFGVL